MSGFMHDVAGAALPVAIGLLVLAAAARAALWAHVEDERAWRVAAQYLPALTVWCLVAIAVHIVALGASGGGSTTAVAVAVLIGAGAVLLRAPGAEREPETAERDAVPAAAPATPPPASSAPGSLWAERPSGETTRTGLWTP